MTNRVGAFVDQTVLITGAAGGFGQSAAHLFAGEGANLVLSDINKEKLAILAAELIEEGAEVADIIGSVAEEGHCKETVDLAMSRFGRLDVAINNAGIGHDPAKTADVDSAQARLTLDVDLMGVFYGMKHQIPVMEAAHTEHGRQSSILNVASLAGLGGAPYTRNAGIAIEPPVWPDAPNHPDYPSAALLPGQTYRQVSRFAVTRKT